MKKNCKKKAISAGIPGLVDGGRRPTPGMLGSGMAYRAGAALAGRRQQIDDAVNGAMQPAPTASTPTPGGLSNIRDGATPPAHMLVAQRRGMVDGGPVNTQFDTTTEAGRSAMYKKIAALSRPPEQVLETGRSFNDPRNNADFAGMGRPLRPMNVVYNQERAAAGMPSGSQIRSGLGLPAVRQNPNMRFYRGANPNPGFADGGMKRGNAAKIETGDGGTVRGPGGPTDDRVGPVALANTEYVLPGDTVEAMGGVEVLDKIRAATHKFVDPKNKPAIGKGMANGGYVVNEMPVEEISMGRSRADRAAIDSAVQRGQRPPGMEKNPTRTPALDRVSAKMQQPKAAAKAPSGRTAGIAKGLGATGLAAGAYDSLTDIDSGYRDKFQQDMGVETPLGSVAADTTRTLGNVGDAVTFGLAGRTGRGIASMIGGGDFSEGFAQPSDRSKFLAQQGGAQAAEMPAQPTVAQPTAQPAQPTAAAPGAASTVAMPGMPTIGKINVSRQPNGVMSFSGKDQVDGYEGPAANQLRGGGYSGAVTPADYQAAVARAESDKAAAAALDRPSGNTIGMRLPQTFGEAMQYRAAMSMNRLNQRANESESRETTDRMRIAAGLKESPLDQERTRGAKMENDRSAMLSQMVNTYLTAPDEATRNDALTKLNALNGKNGGADKYITVDVDTGQKDLAGNPIYAKVPFNTRTGQIVDVSGGGAAQRSGGGLQGKKGDRATDPVTGIAYEHDGNDWVPVK